VAVEVGGDRFGLFHPVGFEGVGAVVCQMDLGEDGMLGNAKGPR
jgi:hypothetical protein